MTTTQIRHPGCPRSLLGLLLILMTLHGSLPPENSVRKGALLHLLTDLLRQFFYSNIKIKKTANVLRHFSSVTTFNAQNIDQITSVTGTLFHDDAVAVYLNGQLITSADMPDEKHENNLYYAGVSAGAPKEASVVLTKDQLKSILKEGSKRSFCRTSSRP